MNKELTGWRGDWDMITYHNTEDMALDSSGLDYTGKEGGVGVDGKLYLKLSDWIRLVWIEVSR